MERCPNCRAQVRDAEDCRRCGLDLRRLMATERVARDLVLQAVARLSQGDPTTARRALQHSLRLHRTRLAVHLLGFIEGTTDTTHRAPTAPEQGHRHRRALPDRGSGRSG